MKREEIGLLDRNIWIWENTFELLSTITLYSITELFLKSFFRLGKLGIHPEQIMNEA